MTEPSSEQQAIGARGLLIVAEHESWHAATMRLTIDNASILTPDVQGL